MSDVFYHKFHFAGVCDSSASRPPAAIGGFVFQGLGRAANFCILGMLLKADNVSSRACWPAASFQTPAPGVRMIFRRFLVHGRPFIRRLDILPIANSQIVCKSIY